MSQPVTPRQLARVAAVAVLLAVTATAAQIRRGDDPPQAISPGPATTADPLTDELAGCRTIAPEELTAGQPCERAWAENRRRFFTPGKSPSRTPQLEMFPGLPADAAKDHDQSPAQGAKPGGVR